MALKSQTAPHPSPPGFTLSAFFSGQVIICEMGVRMGDEMAKNVTFVERTSAIAAFERKWRNGFCKALKALSQVEDRRGKKSAAAHSKLMSERVYK